MIDLDQETLNMLVAACFMLSGMFFMSALLDEPETPKKKK